jgi:hypothetical protein
MTQSDFDKQKRAVACAYDPLWIYLVAVLDLVGVSSSAFASLLDILLSGYFRLPAEVPVVTAASGRSTPPESFWILSVSLGDDTS